MKVNLFKEEKKTVERNSENNLFGTESIHQQQCVQKWQKIAK